MRFGRKASMLDMVQIMIFGFILGIVILVATYMKDQINPDLKDMLGTKGDQVVDVTDTVFTIWDSFFVFIAFGMGIGAIVMAYMVRFNPVFFFFSIIMVAILLILAPIFSNVMREFWSEDEFVGYQSDYPMMLQIFQYYPHFVLVIATILNIVMFGKWRSERI